MSTQSAEDVETQGHAGQQVPPEPVLFQRPALLPHLPDAALGVLVGGWHQEVEVGPAGVGLPTGHGATVPVEVAPEEAGVAREHDPVEAADRDSLTALGLPRPGPVPCITVRWQLAQKFHACTDHLDGIRPNDRARDLPDILVLGAFLAANLCTAAVDGLEGVPPTVEEAAAAVRT